MRARYWAHSKIAEKIREWGGIKKMPKSATFEEWSEWHKNAKLTNKFADWLSGDFMDMAQNFCYWPYDKLEDFVYWVRNRFIEKEWVLKTDLDKNTWHETNTKILHGCFEELRRFVTQQKAHMNAWSDKNSKWVPWHQKWWITRHFVHWESEHLGINYLLWETSLKQDEEWFDIWEDSTPEEREEKIKAAGDKWMAPTFQAERALDILELYCWWVHIRPMRPDPWEVSGYNDLFRNEFTKGDKVWDRLIPKNKELEEKRYECYRKIEEIEKQFEDEDTEMLIKLIKIRRELWT